MTIMMSTERLGRCTGGMSAGSTSGGINAVAVGVPITWKIKRRQITAVTSIKPNAQRAAILTFWFDLFETAK